MLLIPACDLCSSSVLLWRRSYSDQQLSAMRIPTLHMILYYPGLVILTGLLPSSGGVYVRRGDNITDCSMKCPHTNGVLQMYRVCGGDETPLLELWCDNMWHYNRYQPRLLYNASIGCWSLTDAGKDDSCIYNVVYYGEIGRFLTTFPITVLDPVLISNITSNGSRPSDDIAVTVQFSGEEAAVTWEVDEGLLPARYRLRDDNRTVIISRARRDDGRRLHVRITNPVSEETQEYRLEITESELFLDPAASDPASVPGGNVAIGIMLPVMVIAFIALLVTYRCRKKRKTEDEERRTEENGGMTIISSQTDHPAEEEAETGEKTSFLIRIHEIWGRIWRIRGYDETPQRDGVEMEVVPSVPAGEPGGGGGDTVTLQPLVTIHTDY